MKFRFKAKRKNGEEYDGVEEAEDRFALYRELHKEEATIVSVEEIGGEAPPRRFFADLLSRVGVDEEAMFTRNLGGMLTAGLSLSRALSVLEKQASKKKLRQLFAALNEEVRKGKSLHQALAVFPAVFPPFYVAMVSVGEESGNLADSLRIVAEQMSKSAALRRKVLGAMIYPALVLCVMIVIAFLLLVYVVPSLATTFNEIHAELPLSTRVVIGTSDFLKAHTIVGLMAILAAAFISFFLSRVAFVRRLYDHGALRMPIIGTLVQHVNTARTARTLSSLLSAGVSVVEALHITSDVVQNVFFKEVILEAADHIQKGQPISGVFASHEDLYPPFLAEMVAVGEETGKLSEMLLGVAKFYEEEVDEKTKDMSTIIEPFLMVVIGAAVGFFAISMISPIYSVMNTI